ncbi:MAG: hypothetical protein ACJAUK_002530, partial [Colwellia polaris]
ESLPAALQRYDFIIGTITPKALTATAVAADKVYDGNTTATSTVSALKSGSMQ